MTTLYPVQDAMVRGEISPRLHARASLDLYRAALSKCENFITLPHGGIRKRGATYFVGEVKDSSKRVRGIPFIFSSDQAYFLEVGDEYLRIYAYGARVGTVELVTPWPEAILDELQFIQSADVMWIVHDDYVPRILTRTDHTSWTLTQFVFEDGPFDAVNDDAAKSMYVSGVSGSITITADFAAFTTADVGRLIRIDMESYSAIPPWAPGAKLATQGEEVGGKRVRYEGNVYRSATTGSSGAGTGGWLFGQTPPTHLKGVEADGVVGAEDLNTSSVSGIAWEYLHSGFGIAVITSYASAGEVTASVLSRFPDEIVGAPNKSDLWRLGAFGRGEFAGGVALFEERLTLSRRFSVYASKTGDFDSFRLGEKDDDALEFLQAGGGQANDIVWIADADGFLLVATTGGVRALSGSGIDEALTPSSFKNRKSRTAGCARIRPVDAGSSFLYVTRSRKSIAELVQNSSGRFTSDDIGQISEHIPKKGVVEIAFQTDPDPILWFPLQNGEMGGYTHQPSQEVRGMHRHRIAGSFAGSEWGIVESAVVTPGQYGTDDVWLIVKRTINGATKRYIEIMAPPFEYGALEDAFQVDCGLSHYGAATNTVTGLWHLEGEAVDVLAGGKVYKGLTVSGGSVSLPDGATATPWHVGLPYHPGADTLELDVGGRDGSRMGRAKKVSKVILSVMETDTTGLEISSFMRGRWESVKIPSIVAPDGKANLETRNVEVPIDDSWEGQGRVRIRHTNPTPCTIRAITPVFDAEP